MSLQNTFERLRQPEYVGKNRCLPCTILNLVIAVVGAGATGGALVTFGSSTPVSLSGATFVLVGGIVTVYFRGYLVPGTPRLTKRYLPLWALRLFGKDPNPVRDEAGDVEVESVLLDAGALEVCADRDDLCLTPSFDSRWRARIDSLASVEPSIEHLIGRGELGGAVDGADVTFEERGDAYVASLEDRRLAQWESKAAFRSDAAAAAVLRDRYAGWRVMGFHERTEVAGSLRLWLERCPACEGPVKMGQETVSSCCRERQVLASSCEACGSRLFEADVAPGALDAD